MLNLSRESDIECARIEDDINMNVLDVTAGSFSEEEENVIIVIESVDDMERQSESESGNSSADAQGSMFKYKMAHLNVNGWTKQNKSLRLKMIEHSNADFICINETHLKANDYIEVAGYNWIGFNRPVQHMRLNRSFGGIGLLYKISIANEFHVEIKDKSIDGFLSVLFKHNLSEFKMIVGACYLPPENGRWGNNSTEYFAHITGNFINMMT